MVDASLDYALLGHEYLNIPQLQDQALQQVQIQQVHSPEKCGAIGEDLNCYQFDSQEILTQKRTRLLQCLLARSIVNETYQTLLNAMQILYEAVVYEYGDESNGARWVYQIYNTRVIQMDQHLQATQFVRGQIATCNQFLGLDQNKYLKYKNKYLELKKKFRL